MTTENTHLGLNRRIGIATREGEARAAVEDDFHRIRVAVRHEDGKVIEVHGETIRRPWTRCEFATERLQDFAGMNLNARSSAAAQIVEQRMHCTHMLDLTGIAVACAARGVKARTYHAFVPDRIERRTNAILTRDGEETLRWDLLGGKIQNADKYNGVGVNLGFAKWVEENLDDDEAEAALILRRAVFLSGARAPATGGAAYLKPESTPTPHAACFAHQPEQAALGASTGNPRIEFTGHADDCLADDAGWLSFRL